MELCWRLLKGTSAYKISCRTFYINLTQIFTLMLQLHAQCLIQIQLGDNTNSANAQLRSWMYLLMCHSNQTKPSPTLPGRCPFPGPAHSWLPVCLQYAPISISPQLFRLPPALLPGVQASASTWLLNLSLSPVLKPTSEGKLNILRAVCWCLYLIKCTDEVLIYCRAVFTLYYKEITQLEWDQAGNTVSRFHNLMAKRKQEPGGGWRRVGWWVDGVGDYGGGLSWHKHDNIQEARSLFNIAASMLTTSTPGGCLSKAELMSWNPIKHRWWIFPKHQ